MNQSTVSMTPPNWGHVPGWRARLAAIWHILRGRSVMFNVWVVVDSLVKFDGEHHVIGGGFRESTVRYSIAENRGETTRIL